MDSFERMAEVMREEIYRREEIRFNLLKNKLSEAEKQLIRESRNKWEIVQTFYEKYNIPQDTTPLIGSFEIDK